MRYPTRIGVIVCALLMAAFLSPAGAAKPAAEGDLLLVGIEFAPTPDGACAGRAAAAIDGDGRYVTHALSVDGIEVAKAEKVRVPRDSFAELFVTLEGKANAELSYVYEAELFLNFNDTVSLDSDFWTLTEVCDIPSTSTYVNGSPEPAGRWWNAVVVAGGWEDPNLTGRFVVDGVSHGVSGVYDGGGDTTDFRFEGISKKVSSVQFFLVFGDETELPTPTVITRR